MGGSEVNVEGKRSSAHRKTGSAGGQIRRIPVLTAEGKQIVWLQQTLRGMAMFRQTPPCKESTLPCAPPPSPVLGCRRNLGMAVLSSSPEFHEAQEIADMSDSLVVALSRMRVEQSSLKRKKHSEHERPPGLENHDRIHQEQKRAKNNQRQSGSSSLKRQTYLTERLPSGTVNTSFPVPST